jgi:hypothetical protein
MKTHCVEVVEAATDKVVRRLGPMSERKAEKVERGLEINLNHDRFFVRVVPRDEKKS